LLGFKDKLSLLIKKHPPVVRDVGA
jgi:hypothetical protein